MNPYWIDVKVGKFCFKWINSKYFFLNCECLLSILAFSFLFPIMRNIFFFSLEFIRRRYFSHLLRQKIQMSKQLVLLQTSRNAIKCVPLSYSKSNWDNEKKNEKWKSKIPTNKNVSIWPIDRHGPLTFM